MPLYIRAYFAEKPFCGMLYFSSISPTFGLDPTIRQCTQ